MKIMKKRLQGLLSGVLIGAMMTGGVVFAKEGAETLNVIYDNIKIIIDGKEYQPTDANGNAVEPFIYNGTTYLPVRAIATAFDKDVDWEAQTSTVTLGSKNYDWLDQMGFADYDTTSPKNTFSAIAEKTQMTDGMKYDRGIQFYLRDSIYRGGGTIENNDGTLECYQEVSYLLNGAYKSFEGVVSAISSYNGGSAVIKFYGDGKLLYTSPIVSSGMKSAKFDVDVENVKLLKIHVEFFNVRNSDGNIKPCIADARLAKK